MKSKYDIAVIGAGSSGLVAATSAARNGAKTVLIEKKKIGGECLHTACVPSKTFISSSKLLPTFTKAQEKGIINHKLEPLNFAAVMENIQGVIHDISLHENQAVYENMGIDVLIDKEGAKFINQRQIRIGKEIIEADYSVICSGSSPRQINVSGSEGISFLDNENFWNMRKQPASILFIGGGPVGVELGQALQRLGSQVTIIDNNPEILGVVDNDIVKVVVDVMITEGVRLINSVSVQSFKKIDGRIQTLLKQEDNTVQVETDAVFLATGRTPNISGLDLENAGVEFSEKGIKVNEFLQTTTHNIYACGDVASPLKFTHIASYQANICINNIINGNKSRNDFSAAPWVIFTDPEVAHVGLSEKEAKEKFDNIKVFKVDATMDRFMAEGKAEGFLKIVLDDKDHILGADAVGANSGEWIQLITLAIKNKIPLQSFTDTIFAYPTFSEIVKKAFTRFLRKKTEAMV